ncbi:MAG: OmpA family protein [Deltaproteobacteria bacterium]|nr:MAG: OmpA family protein [Deltaproteobacteria bacterium]
MSARRAASEFGPARRAARPATCAAAVAVACLAACAGAELRARSGAVRDLIATAKDNGAVRCAPRELALAESHVDFADQELDEGRYYPARSELAIAERNARAAVRKSPKDRCAPKAEPAVTAPSDRDGDGIVDPQDECPDDPEDKDGFQDADGCPDPDNDVDGILDADDKCPNDAEDADGFEDGDGCPEDDNDGDGLADAIDQCPNEAEDADGFEDDDGCPDCDNDGDGVPECPQVVDQCPDQPAQTPDGCPKKYKNVVVTKSKIELKQTIYFETGKATIKPVSFGLLDEVAQALKDNPTITVRIEGHTDSRGSRAYNLRLSDARAKAVRDYLIAKGIAPERMVAQGFGEDVPIADNRTAEGRAQNRRVEFVITSR